MIKERGSDSNSSRSEASHLGGTTVIYEWNAWEDYLLPTILPKARRMSARVGQDYRDLLSDLKASDRYLIFHLGLTQSARIPQERRALIERCQSIDVRVVNGHVTDISKKSIQAICQSCGLPSTLVTRTGSPDELLIVKTNRNYGGEDERHLKPSECALLGITAVQNGFIEGPRSYKVFGRSEVPKDIWDDEQLIIERFISNRENVFFRVYVLYKAMVVEAAVSHLIIKRMYDGLPRSLFFFQSTQPVSLDTKVDDLQLGTPPIRLMSSVRTFCEYARLEFGTIDIVVDDAMSVFIVDVNTTPFWGREDMDYVPTFLRSHALL